MVVRGDNVPEWARDGIDVVVGDDGELLHAFTARTVPHGGTFGEGYQRVYLYD